LDSVSPRRCGPVLRLMEGREREREVVLATRRFHSTSPSPASVARAPENKCPLGMCCEACVQMEGHTLVQWLACQLRFAKMLRSGLRVDTRESAMTLHHHRSASRRPRLVLDGLEGDFGDSPRGLHVGPRARARCLRGPRTTLLWLGRGRDSARAAVGELAYSMYLELKRILPVLSLMGGARPVSRSIWVLHPDGPCWRRSERYQCQSGL
jgi:hypothetical protein